MSKKRRVYQVAKEFDISNEALIKFLLKLRFDIRNHMSQVTDEMFEQVVKNYGESAEPVGDEYEFRKMLKDKKAKEEKKKKEALEEVEKRLKTASKLAAERPKTKKKAAKEKEEEEKKPATRRKKVAAEEEVAEVKKTRRRVKAAEEEVEKQKAKKVKEEKPKARRGKRADEEKVEEKKKPAKRRIKVVDIPQTEKVGKEDKGKPDKRKRAKAEKEAAEEAKPEKIDIDAIMEKAKPKRKRKRKKTEGAAVATEAEKAAAEKEKAKEKAKDKKPRKRRKKRKPQFTEEEIAENIRQTMAAMEEAGKPKRRKKKTKAVEDDEEQPTNVIKVTEFISAAELAELMEIESSELITKCLELGMIVSINQRLDMDTIVIVASEFGFEVELVDDYSKDIFDEIDEEEDETDLTERPPVVTIMGHVDHGKTSLLDRIRESNIIAGEVGGITQHIGAYEVSVDSKAITFLDTPGHEAFTAMRARGAQVTDIVVLVVAADDAVMPQTIEAINHAKAAGVSIIVAINKIDKPGANPDMIKQQLADHGVLVESWGGKYQSVELSAKSGEGIDKLLEMILIEAELLELKANANRMARCVVVEARLDKGKGVVASVLVQKGTLKVGDPFVAGQYSGRIRSMFDERGNKVKSAGPSAPVQVIGFSGTPQAGDTLVVLESEKETRDISQRRQQLRREQESRLMRHLTLDQISKEIKEGKLRQLNIIVKADVDGSIEALSDSLMKLGTKEVAVHIVHKGVGAVSESDVLLASASNAVIIGFHIRPTLSARTLASKEEVDIRIYDIIYDATEDVKAALEGMLEPEITEKISATIEVRQVFKVPKIGAIAGCYVVSGKINRNDKLKLYRDNKLVHEGKIHSLKRFKDDVKEVASGFECGIGIEGFDDLKVSDIIETFEIIKTDRKL